MFTDNYMGGSFPHWQTAPVRRTRKSRVNCLRRRSAVRNPLAYRPPRPPGAPMNTRVPFDDDYVKLVGTAVYLFSYYEWAIIYVVERLEPGFVREYCRKHRRGMTSGTVFTRFMNAVERYAGDKGVRENRAQVLRAHIRSSRAETERTHPRAPHHRRRRRADSELPSLTG